MAATAAVVVEGMVVRVMVLLLFFLLLLLLPPPPLPLAPSSPSLPLASHDWPLVPSWSSSSWRLSLRCRTVFNLSITLLWNLVRETDEGLLEGPWEGGCVLVEEVAASGLMGGLVVPGECGSMEVLDAHLEVLVDM